MSTTFLRRPADDCMRSPAPFYNGPVDARLASLEAEISRQAAIIKHMHAEIRRLASFFRRAGMEHPGIASGPVGSIQLIVCEVWGVPTEAMASPRRSRVWAWPRQAAIDLCRHYVPELSLPDIGRIFRRDHTSIMHAIKACRARLAVDDEFTAKYREAEARVVAALEARRDG